MTTPAITARLVDVWPPIVVDWKNLIGVNDLDDPVLAGLTRDARYDTLLGLADANLRAARPVVLVAPFSAERTQPSAWAATARRLAADPCAQHAHTAVVQVHIREPKRRSRAESARR
jgi:hypothetical protein